MLQPLTDNFLSDARAADSAVGAIVGRARAAQQRWGERTVYARTHALASVERSLATHGMTLAQQIAGADRDPAEVLVSEVFPVADAIQFLRRRAPKLLRTVHHGRRGLPLWLSGTQLQVRREPFGVILIVGPSNYPLLLPGVQALQALAAGNAVVVKPAPGCSQAMFGLRDMLRAADIDVHLLGVLPEAVDSVEQAMNWGVDKVVFTGSTSAGRKVVAAAAARMIPCVAELSGHDPVFVCPDADLKFAARGLAFGLRFNGSATCVAPRRVFVVREQMQTLLDHLGAALQNQRTHRLPEQVVRHMEALALDAVGLGGRVAFGAWADRNAVQPIVVICPNRSARLLREGVFAPLLAIVPVESMEQALEWNGDCPFALGATIFTAGNFDSLSRRINAGVVVVNDMIVPHADPRMPFGGRNGSGSGVTRGAEGLVEMTRVKAIDVRSGRLRPHFDPLTENHAAFFQHYLLAAHGGAAQRAKGFGRLLVAAVRLARGKAAPSAPSKNEDVDQNSLEM